MKRKKRKQIHISAKLQMKKKKKQRQKKISDYIIKLFNKQCAVPENIHTPTMEGLLFCTLPTPQEIPFIFIHFF